MNQIQLNQYSNIFTVISFPFADFYAPGAMFEDDLVLLSNEIQKLMLGA